MWPRTSRAQRATHQLRSALVTSLDVVAAVIAILPVVSWWVWSSFVRPRPFWVHFYDPEAIFFFSAQALLAGEGPQNVDHPGFITTYLSALIQVLSGFSGIDLDGYRRLGYGVISMLACGALIAILWLLRELPLMLRVGTAWSLLIAPRMLEMFTVVTTEALYPLFLVLFAICLTRVAEAPRKRALVLLGVSFGALLSLKFLFLAWCPAVAVFLFLCGDRRKAVGRLGIVMMATASTFLLCALPALDRLAYMISWLMKLATRSGAYGSGSTGLPSANDVVRQLSDAFLTAKMWHALILGGFLLCLIVRWRKPPPRSPALLFFCILAYAGTIATIIRNEFDGRYLLPLAILPVLLVYDLREEIGASRFRSALLAAVLIAVFAKALLLSSSVHLRQSKAGVVQRARIHAALAEAGRTNEPILYAWRVPEPSFALNVFAWGKENKRKISQRYPREGHYDEFTGTIHPPARGEWRYAVLAREQLERFPAAVEVVGTVDRYVIVRRRQGDSRTIRHAESSR